MQTLLWWIYWPLSWLLIVASAWYLPDRWRNSVGWGILGIGGALSLYLAVDLAPWQRLLTSTVGLILLLKAVVLLQIPRQELQRYSHVGLGLFMTVWPGMNPAPFANIARFNAILAQRLFKAGLELWLAVVV